MTKPILLALMFILPISAVAAEPGVSDAIAASSENLVSVASMVIPQPPKISEEKAANHQAEVSKHSYVWNEGSTECTKKYVNDECHLIIDTANIKISCYQKPLKYRHKNYVLAKITIANQGKEPITVFPSKFHLEADNNGLLQSIQPIDIDNQCAKTTRHTMIWSGLSGGSYIPGQGYSAPIRSYSNTYGNISGSGNFASYNGSTNTSYYRGGGISGAIASSLASKAETLRVLQQYVLRANTVGPGEKLKGVLVFPSMKGAETHLNAMIENETFYF